MVVSRPRQSLFLCRWECRCERGICCSVVWKLWSWHFARTLWCHVSIHTNTQQTHKHTHKHTKHTNTHTHKTTQTQQPQQPRQPRQPRQPKDVSLSRVPIPLFASQVETTLSSRYDECRTRHGSRAAAKRATTARCLEARAAVDRHGPGRVNAPHSPTGTENGQGREESTRRSTRTSSGRTPSPPPGARHAVL